MDINRYNDFLKLMRVTAYVLRFISNLKAKRQQKPLVLKKYVVVNEIIKAKLLWIKDNQSTLEESTYDEIKINLNLNVDNEGVVRSYGRLKNSQIPFSAKAPIFLNKKHKLAEIIVYYVHLKVFQ